MQYARNIKISLLILVREIMMPYLIWVPTKRVLVYLMWHTSPTLPGLCSASTCTCNMTRDAQSDVPSAAHVLTDQSIDDNTQNTLVQISGELAENLAEQAAYLMESASCSALCFNSEGDSPFTFPLMVATFLYSGWVLFPGLPPGPTAVQGGP